MKTLALIAVLLLPACIAAADRDTRLPDAAEQDDKVAVRSLLKRKANVNAAQGDGATALHWAAFHDDLETARLLLAAGAKVEPVTRIGSITPLLMASRNGSAPMLRLLLDVGAQVDTTNNDGTTPLMLASASGSVEAVSLLLSRGATVNRRETARWQTALMFAAALNRDAVIRVLMAHGADANITSLITKPRFAGAPAPAPNDPPPTDVRAAGLMGGQTALLYAARDGQTAAVHALIESGAAVNKVSSEAKISPLVMAIINGHFDIAKYLLDHGADPNLTTSTGLAALYATIDVEWAPLAWVPQPITDQQDVGYLDLMSALIARGARVNQRLGQRLWFRSYTSDRSWVEPAGSTAFWRAAQAADLPAMKLLVAAGADPKIAAGLGDTALMVAAGVGWAPNFTKVAGSSWLAAVEYCAELGLDVNASDGQGYTALHGAAFRGDDEMIRFLVDRGARTDAKTTAGDTVADMANGPIPHSIPHPETVALLVKLGSANSHNCRSDQCLVAPVKDNQ